MNKIKQARIALKLTRIQLADAVSCHKSYVYMLETDKRQPSREMIKKLSYVLKIKVGDLI